MSYFRTLTDCTPSLKKRRENDVKIFIIGGTLLAQITGTLLIDIDNLPLLRLSIGLENLGIVFREILLLLLPINYSLKRKKGGNLYEVKTALPKLLI